ncbi:hypothetical protein ANCCAN_07582 [Ancylostoma caninum]|uniref:Uncharacterized protein n=1 Tax=Ancylostoma caninum TaxID=29170 RepID=A0A368GQ11_ANCCA|nr:hypothetical protein ANCCAN_07582 [Ancylostoma caninum]
MKYLILVVLPGLVDPRGHGYDFDFPRVIPANFREGNRYHVEVDNAGSRLIYKGIAIIHKGQNVYYAEHSDHHDCTMFAAAYSDIQRCRYEYLILQGNDRYYQRQPMLEWINGELNCDKIIGVKDHMLVLIKHDVMNPNSEKFVGTYSKSKDAVYYIAHSNKRKVLRNVKKDLKSGKLSAQMLEVVCEQGFRSAGLQERANKAYSN